jgi:hypothetical protein
MKRTRNQTHACKLPAETLTISHIDTQCFVLIHCLVSLGRDPQPLPKPAQHKVRPRASFLQI